MFAIPMYCYTCCMCRTCNALIMSFLAAVMRRHGALSSRKRENDDADGLKKNILCVSLALTVGKLDRKDTCVDPSVILINRGSYCVYPASKFLNKVLQ
jgi:hypothetical protein